MYNPSTQRPFGAACCGSLGLVTLGPCAVGACWRWPECINATTHSPPPSQGWTVATLLALVHACKQSSGVRSSSPFLAFSWLHPKLPRRAGTWSEAFLCVPTLPRPAPRLGILPFCKVVTFTYANRLLHSLCYCSLGNLCVADRGVLARSTLTTPSWRRRSYLHRGLSPPRPSRLSTSTSRQCSDRRRWACAMGRRFLGYSSSDTQSQMKEL